MIKRVDTKELWNWIHNEFPDTCSYSFMIRNEVGISSLLGKTITSITLDDINEAMLIECSDGSTFVFYHEQDCCESVEIDDICGELEWLIGNPITLAEEIVQTDRDENNSGAKSTWDGSYTWTFYHLATIKGYVDIRWYGSSNGYYSESVSFVQIKEATNND